MPRTPDLDEDDLDPIPPPGPVFYAEQALLGALLLEPWRLDDVTDIGPEAFSTAVHAAVFAAIRSLPAPAPVQHAENVKWLDAVLSSAREQTRGLNAAYLHTLIQMCPWPRHASAYAEMVEADHAHRTLRTHAQRLAQTATDPTLPHPVETALAEAAALSGLLEALSARFRPHPNSLPRTPSLAPVNAPQVHEEAMDEERLLLATATAHPAEVEQMRWLTADDLTLPLHAGLWRCLTSLSRRAAPVDPVTVLWEAQRNGLLTAGAEPADIISLLTAGAGSPQYWGERILQRALLATAHETGRRIEAYTDDPATTPYQLVTGSRRALADLNALRTRWHHATSPTPPSSRPPRPQLSAPPRAGPPRTAMATSRIPR
ncbi:DnaB-like helicase N-terminal domain-containing protein [Streptomyces sp. NPDC050388]|uniref:DnaB-like helicase N-terminal domain-containing protein n=1 Tax=Streptomyces sp. NPDC050388 TaxID=3155781 RepID=UPI003446342D